ncbi:MAG: ABC transporter permease [Candidatus Omnitrophica bacterium]|nr:ABC transporter permease [Candidatus Omnitrophota bacterium]
MIAYLLRRLAGLIPLFIGITLISFAIIHLAPGGPTVATEFNPKVSLEVRSRIAKLYGLDLPLHVQYLRWVGRIARGDFGRSFLDDRPVGEKIVERMPITLAINILSLSLILLIAIPLGVAAAAKPRSGFDQSTTLLVFLGFSMPEFWLALLLMAWLGVAWGVLPISGLVSIDGETWGWAARLVDLARHLVLPVFVAAFGGLAGLSRYMRSATLEVLRQDYIRTAYAKGLSSRQVLYRHALRNAILPIVTILGLSLPGLIGGSVIFETIFAIPGMGRLYFEAVMARDYPVVMGVLTLGAGLTLMGNLLADVAYAWVDPRIRVGERS